MNRFWNRACRGWAPHGILALTFLWTLTASSPANAQATTGTAGTTGTTTVGTLAATDLFIGVQHVQGENLKPYDLARFFNKANCDCDEPVFIYVSLTNSGFAKKTVVPTGTVQFFIGVQCDNVVYQRQSCVLLKSEQISTFLAQGRDTIATTARFMSTNSAASSVALPDGGVSTPSGIFTPTPDCTSVTNGFTQTVWALFDYGADGTFDLTVQQAVAIDLTPPAAPTNVTVEPGNEALTVRWTPVDYSLDTGLQGYQILCQRGDNLQVFTNGTFTEAVKSCPATKVGAGPAALDPAFVCSPLLNRGNSSFRVKILQNGIPYGATVVAVDNSGNGSVPDVQFAVPEKTDSFYDVYRNGNVTNGGAGQTETPGKATGGFCAVAEHGASRPEHGAAIALAIAGGLAVVRRRRRR